MDEWDNAEWMDKFSRQTINDQLGILISQMVREALISDGRVTNENWEAIFSEPDKEAMAAYDARHNDIATLTAVIVTLAKTGLESTALLASVVYKVFELGWLASREDDDDWEGLL